MQQTQTYQLNLIETSDAFSPLPLNENAQKLEAAIAAETAARASAVAGEAQARAAGDAAEASARQTAIANEAAARQTAVANEATARAAADAALDARVQVFEARHMAIGTFVGQANLTVNVGFTPRVVFVQLADKPSACNLMSEYDTSDKTSYGQIVSGGFHFLSSDYNFSVNRLGSLHCYLALD